MNPSGMATGFTDATKLAGY